MHGEQIEEINNNRAMDDEALRNNEPVIIKSHMDSREYATYLQGHVALPENYDDIFDAQLEEQPGLF